MGELLGYMRVGPVEMKLTVVWFCCTLLMLMIVLPSAFPVL